MISLNLKDKIILFDNFKNWRLEHKLIYYLSICLMLLIGMTGIINFASAAPNTHFCVWDSANAVCNDDLGFGTTPLTLEFHDISLDYGGSSPDSWIWDFGDGITDTSGGIVSHTYSEHGIYNVSLTNCVSGDCNTLLKESYIGVADVAPSETNTESPIETQNLQGCGNLSVLAVDKGTNYILWSWDMRLNITHISIDGSFVPKFDNTTNSYIASKLDENSVHYITIYNKNQTGCNTTKTNTSSSSNIWGTIDIYLLFILALICLIVGFFIPPVGFGATLFSLAGILFGFNGSATLLILYVICFMVGLGEGLITDW